MTFCRLRIAVLIVSLVWLSSPGSLAVADASGMEILMQTILNRGDRTIHTGEFRYTLRVTEESPSKEMIADQIAQVRAALRENMKLIANNPAELKQLQNDIDTADQYIPQQVRDNADGSYGVPGRSVQICGNGLEPSDLARLGAVRTVSEAVLRGHGWT